MALAVIAEGLFTIALQSPFSRHAAEFREAATVAPLALSFCALVGLRYLFRLPVELRANWVFRIHEPGHAAEMLAGVEACMLYFGVIPVAVLTLPIELRLLGAVAGLEAGVLCLLVSLVWMQILLFSFEKIPFTSSYMPGQQPLIQSVVHYVTVAALYIGVTGSIVRWAVASPPRTIILLLLLSAACWKARRARFCLLRIERRNSRDPGTCGTAASPERRLTRACSRRGLRRAYCLGPPPFFPPPRAGAGGSVPPSARIFIFSIAVVNCMVRCALSRSRAASSASVELSSIKV